MEDFLVGHPEVAKVIYPGLQTGVTRSHVRLSIGIEHPDDIIADLDRALAAATGVTRLAAE